MSTELKNAVVVREETQLAEKPNDLLSAIAAAVVNPLMDVSKMERLLAMHEKITADQRRTSFYAALNRLAPKLPEIAQNGRVVFEGRGGAPGMDRRYARLEDIDRAIRPLYSEEGFSLSFDTDTGEGGKIRIMGRLAHKDGHSEIKQLDLPHDSSGSKNGIQAVGSTVSYGRRMLVKMFFNIIEHGEDTDGNNPEPISEDQILDLKTMISDSGADLKGFLKYMRVNSLAEITKGKLKVAVNALEEKKRGKK